VKNPNKAPSFIIRYEKLADVLTDYDLASLGDAYTNFVCSLALSNLKGQPSGVKVKRKILAAALRKAGLRKHMPTRITRHTLADGAEALIVYAWLRNHMTLDESVAILQKHDDLTEGLTQLLKTIIGRITLA
jgi:hypothetical protein